MGDREHAYHEAGHAVAAHALGVEIEEVSILRECDRVGCCVTNWSRAAWESRPVREQLDARILYHLAGPAAYRELTGERVDLGAGDDVREARKYIRMMAEDEKAVLYFLRFKYIGMAHDLLRPRWEAVETLASILLERRCVLGSEATDLIVRTLPYSE